LTDNETVEHINVPYRNATSYDVQHLQEMRDKGTK